MSKIAVLTATRAEYGLLKPIIDKLSINPNLQVELIVTGAHLSPEFGLTYKEIEKDGLRIAEAIEIVMSSDTASSISKSMGLALISFADYFRRSNPDLFIILGDRYETLAVALAAMNQRIPIVHIYGGESTQGAVDEAMRHALTKLSYLHFTATEAYRKRVIQLGEHPECVFNVGAIGVENIKNMEMLSREQLAAELSMDLFQPYAVVTYHPTTLEHTTAAKQVEELLQALEVCSGINYIFTKSNADADSRVINQALNEFVKQHPGSKLFDSLGVKKYLSALKHSVLVIGNSSSGIIEAPSFNIPTINIGDRQKGRIQASSVINCEPIATSILKAINLGKTTAFQEVVDKAINPYYKENTSELIVEKIFELLRSGIIEIKKSFYDIEFEI